jgi:hypothetical protein
VYVLVCVFGCGCGCGVGVGVNVGRGGVANSMARHGTVCGGIGAQHPHTAVKYARLVHDLGVSDCSVQYFAALGDGDMHNVQRNLHRRIKASYGLEPFVINVPMLSKDGNGLVQTELSTIAPYELFSAMHTAGPAVFMAACLGSSAC